MSKVYYKGDDIKEPILVFQDDGVTPVNIDATFLDIIVSVYTTQTDVKRFSKSERIGHYPLYREDEFEYWLILEGDKTATMKSGDIVVEIMTIINDQMLSDDRLNESFKGVLCPLVESVNSSII